MKKYVTIVAVIILLIVSGFIIYQNNKEYDNELEIYTEENLIVENDIKEESIEKEIEIKKITVEIKGEVVSPGVYQVEENARVNDLINLSGGLTENAVTNNINMAKLLKDEMVVVIYNKNDLIEEIKTEYVYLECKCPEVKNDACIEKDNNDIDIEENDSNKKVSINNALLEELITLNGIGEKTATKIIEYRKDNSFKTIEDIKNVPGIGESLYEKIKDFITI